jgi:hypothetical protein
MCEGHGLDGIIARVFRNEVGDRLKILELSMMEHISQPEQKHPSQVFLSERGPQDAPQADSNVSLMWKLSAKKQKRHDRR